MNRTISQVVFKKKRRKRWGKKSGLQEKGMIYKEHLDSINYRQCTSRKAGSHPVRNWLVHLWRGEDRIGGGPVYWLREGDAGWLQNVWFVSLKKTTSSHICSALWLVEKPLKSVPWANFIEGFYNLINREFSLGVMCRPLSSWLVTQWDWI